jgi:hypothetical protein
MQEENKNKRKLRKTNINKENKDKLNMLWYSKKRNQNKANKNPKTKQTKRKTKNNSPKTKHSILTFLLCKRFTLYIFLQGSGLDLEKFLNLKAVPLHYLLYIMKFSTCFLSTDDNYNFATFNNFNTHMLLSFQC